MSEKWTVKNIPSQKGKTFLITGANSGIGLGATREIIKKGGMVIMAIRNLQKGKLIMEEIRKETADAKIDLMQVDLADLTSVKKFAEEFIRKYT